MMLSLNYYLGTILGVSYFHVFQILEIQSPEQTSSNSENLDSLEIGPEQDLHLPALSSTDTLYLFENK